MNTYKKSFLTTYFLLLTLAVPAHSNPILLQNMHTTTATVSLASSGLLIIASQEVIKAARAVAEKKALLLKERQHIEVCDDEECDHDDSFAAADTGLKTTVHLYNNAVKQYLQNRILFGAEWGKTSTTLRLINNAPQILDRLTYTNQKADSIHTPPKSAYSLLRVFVIASAALASHITALESYQQGGDIKRYTLFAALRHLVTILDDLVLFGFSKQWIKLSIPRLVAVISNIMRRNTEVRLREEKRVVGIINQAGIPPFPEDTSSLNEVEWEQCSICFSSEEEGGVIQLGCICKNTLHHACWAEWIEGKKKLILDENLQQLECTACQNKINLDNYSPVKLKKPNAAT